MPPMPIPPPLKTNDNDNIIFGNFSANVYFLHFEFNKTKNTRKEEEQNQTKHQPGH